MTARVTDYLRLDPLRIRIDTHRRFSAHPDDVDAAVLSALGPTGPERLLDVGSGTGDFLAALAASGHHGPRVAVDTSPAALSTCAALPGVHAVAGDAVRLPFADASFDVVTARHMLYHVSDVGAALRGARRVLRPGGRFAAVVNHPDVTPRIAGLVRERAESHGVPPAPPVNAAVNSATLPAAMAGVLTGTSVVRYDNELVFPEPEPVVAFGCALLGLYGVGPDSPVRAEVADGVRRAVHAWFAGHTGPWREPKGYAVCTGRA